MRRGNGGRHARAYWHRMTTEQLSATEAPLDEFVWLLLDLVSGATDGFSLEAADGVHFVTRSSVCTAAQAAP